MAININHSIGKLKSDDDLKLDAGAGKNIDVSSKIVKNASDPVDPQDLVTKAFLDATLANFDSSQDSEITADLTDVYETIENVRNNTYVKSVDFVSNITSGGAGLTATLTITTEGNPNRYTISWGDGDVTTATTDSTPTHTYADSSGSPFDVQVTAFHNQGVGAGSSQSKTREDYISIFTANPQVSFVAYDSLTGGSQITTWDDGDTVYFQNTTTNTAGATVQFTWNWGDGSADDVINDDTNPGGSAGPRITHTFAASTETDVTRTVSLTLDAHDTMTQSLLPLNNADTFKIYDTHTPDTTSDITTGINEEASNGLDVTFTNNTESTIGNYSNFGITYRWDFGDGTIQTVNVGSGQSGDTGSTITHKYTLSNNSIAQDFTGNLQVISGHSSSPFTSSSFTIHVEPDVRANITGSAVHASDRSGDNQFDVYDGFDYLGNNRAVVEVIDKIRDTASSHNRLFFVEVMGRDAGHIALNSGIGAGAEEILIPEENRGLEQLLESLKKSEKSGKSSSIVVVAEGDKTGKNVFQIAEYVEKNMPNYEVRVSVLGHMQRGGRPSCFDRVLASRMAVKAVESLVEDKSNFMVGLKEDEMILTPLDKAIKGKSAINKDLVRVSDILSL